MAATVRRALIGVIVMAGTPTAAFAENPVQTDNQYEEPSKDPTASPAPVDIDEDGRVALDVRGAFGRGLKLRTRDDSFAVQLRGRVQLQAAQTFEGGSEDLQLVARRVRLVIGGHALSRAITWYLQLGFGPRDLERDLPVPLRDAFVTWHAARDLNLRLGQMKVPFDRQRVTSSSTLQFVDRSALVRSLNLDRDVGLQAFSNDLFGWGGRLSYQLGIFAGNGRNRVNQNMNLLAMGRVQFAPLGRFDDLVEADLARDPRPRLAFAFGVGFNHRTPRVGSTIGAVLEDETFDYLHMTADAVFKWRGLSVLTAFLMRRANARYAVDGAPLPDETRAESAAGGLVQAGFMFTDAFEVVARGEHFRPVGSINAADFVDHTEIGGGLSWYITQHNLKLQADYFAVFDDGLDAAGHRIRTQLQVYF